MLDRQLTDRRIVESILRSERLDIEFDPFEFDFPAGQAKQVKFTIFSTDFADGRNFIFGEGRSDEIWSVLRACLEARDL